MDTTKGKRQKKRNTKNVNSSNNNNSINNSQVRFLILYQLRLLFFFQFGEKQEYSKRG